MTSLSHEAVEVLNIIRQTHSTTDIDSELFAEVCRATVFYLRGGVAAEMVAKLVIEECFPNKSLAIN